MKRIILGKDINYKNIKHNLLYDKDHYTIKFYNSNKEIVFNKGLNLNECINILKNVFEYKYIYIDGVKR